QPRILPGTRSCSFAAIVKESAASATWDRTPILSGRTEAEFYPTLRRTGMFASIFNGGMRLRAARAVLERLAPLLDVRFCVRLWDGSVVPLGEDANLDWCIAISGPGVISSLLRRPTLDNLIQHYAAGRIDFQGTDLFSFWEMARQRRAKVRVRD